MSRTNLGKEPASCGRGDVLRVTERAILVELTDYENREMWIPKSVIHEDSEIDAGAIEGDEGELFVHQWFADQEDL